MPRKMSRKTRVKKRSVRNNKQRKRSNRNSAKKSRKIKRGRMSGGDIPSTAYDANHWFHTRRASSLMTQNHAMMDLYLKDAVKDNIIKQETPSEAWESENYKVFLLNSLKSFVVDKKIFRILNYKIYPETKKEILETGTLKLPEIRESICKQLDKIFYEGKLDDLTAAFTPKEGEDQIVFNSETQERITEIINHFFETEEIKNSKIQIPRAGVLSLFTRGGEDFNFNYLKKTSLINSLLKYNPALENCAVHKYLKLFKQCFMVYVICVILSKYNPKSSIVRMMYYKVMNDKYPIGN